MEVEVCMVVAACGVVGAVTVGCRSYITKQMNSLVVSIMHTLIRLLTLYRRVVCEDDVPRGILALSY